MFSLGARTLFSSFFLLPFLGPHGRLSSSPVSEIKWKHTSHQQTSTSGPLGNHPALPWCPVLILSLRISPSLPDVPGTLPLTCGPGAGDLLSVKSLPTSKLLILLLGSLNTFAPGCPVLSTQYLPPLSRMHHYSICFLGSDWSD